MVDNFELIKNLLSFDSEDDFYFIQILKRRKDNPSMDTDTVVIKEYFVGSMDYFERKYPDMKDQANKHNARLTIRINKRSYKKIAMKTLLDVVEKIEQEQYRSVKSSFSSVAGKYSSDKDKKWVIDFDEGDFEKYTPEEIIKFVNNCMPEGEKHIVTIPSKTGLHIVVKPFNINDFKKQYPNLIIQKDTYTNLYIP